MKDTLDKIMDCENDIKLRKDRIHQHEKAIIIEQRKLKRINMVLNALKKHNNL